jgi:hypothetical protein
MEVVMTEGIPLLAILIGILPTGTPMMNFRYDRQDVDRGLAILAAPVISSKRSTSKQRFVAAVPS